MTKLFLDFETRSVLDIKVCGLDRYAKHPSTQVLMLSWACDEDEPELWFPHLGPMPEKLRCLILDHNVVKVAWNVPFERAIFKFVLQIDIPCEQWLDVMIWARHLSLPGNLEGAGSALGLLPDQAKNKDGKRLIQKFSIPYHKGGVETLFGISEPLFHTWEDEPRDWILFGDYCKQDLRSERTIFGLVSNIPLPETEQKAWILDQKINERGIPVNRKFVQNALALSVESKKRLTVKLKELTGLANPNSRDQFLGWAQKEAYPYLSLGKNFVNAALADNSGITLKLRDALKLRQEASKTSYTKFETILNLLSDDDRLRHQFAFMGASRTGRWAGKDAQVQNQPRTMKDVEKKYDLAIEIIMAADYDAAEKEFPSVIGMTTSCVRSSFQASAGKKLVVCDLSSIENIVLGFLSDCEPILKVFREGRDAYVSFAVLMYHLAYEVLIKDKEKRQVAKPGVLGCGYGLGPGVKKNSDGTYEILYITDRYGNKTMTGLMGYAANMGIKLTPEQSYLAWETFRKAYKEVPELWDKYQKAAIQVLETGRTVKAGKMIFQRRPRKNGTFVLRIILPSGRGLHYMNARVEKEIAQRKSDGSDYERKKFMYDGIGHGVGQIGQGWGPVYSYGGKICLGGDTQVITNRGVIPLTNVEKYDTLWDGKNWVRHAGVIEKGWKSTQKWNGLQATPNHKILAGNKWSELAKMDDLTGLASQLTGLASILRLSFSQCPENLAKLVSNVIADEYLRYQHERYGEAMLNPVRLAPAKKQEKREPRNEGTILFPIPEFVNSCSTDAQESSQGVVILSPKLIKIMEDEGLPFTRLGKTVLRNGSTIFSLFQVGITRVWNWIELRIMEIMNPETSILSRENKTRIIEELLFVLCMKADHSPTPTFGVNLLPYGPRTPFSITSGAGGLQNGAWSGIKTQKVYDILNAGPNNQFTVLTESGAAIVHNCENVDQAFSRDVLVSGLMNADALGLNIVMHVHDEIVCEEDDDPFAPGLTDLKDCMTRIPDWSPGLILGADGFEGKIYKKG